MRNTVGSLVCKRQKSRQSENGKEFLPKHRPPSRASPPPSTITMFGISAKPCAVHSEFGIFL